MHGLLSKFQNGGSLWTLEDRCIHLHQVFDLASEDLAAQPAVAEALGGEIFVAPSFYLFIACTPDIQCRLKIAAKINKMCKQVTFVICTL